MRAKPQHGTIGMYTNHKCRCEDCREAWATYYRVRNGGSAPVNKVMKYGISKSTNNQTPGTTEKNAFPFVSKDQNVLKMIGELHVGRS